MAADLIDELTRRLARRPGRMHVYHYAAYEETALKRLTGRHGIREAELDQLLRGERFVDLYRRRAAGDADQQAVLLDQEARGVLLGAHRTAADAGVADAMSQRRGVRAWLVDGDAAVLDAIESTTTSDDVARPASCTTGSSSGAPSSRRCTAPSRGPTPGTGRPARPSDAEAAETELADRLHDGRAPAAGGLVGWHRREDRPAWWDVYRLKDLDDRGRSSDDGTALGRAVRAGLRPEKQEPAVRVRVPGPGHEGVRSARTPLDVDTAKKVGEVFELDAAGRWLVLKTTATEPPRPRGLGPAGPLDARCCASRSATGEDVLAGRDCLGQALVERRGAGARSARGGEPDDAGDRAARPRARRRGAGDPGAAGERQDDRRGRADPRAAGRREDGRGHGDVPRGHRQPARRRSGRPALQKCDESQHCGSDDVAWSPRQRGGARKLLDGDVNLVGGTAWFWARAGRGAGRRRAGGRRGGAVLAGQRRRGGAGRAVDGAAGRPAAAGPAEPGGAPRRSPAPRRWSTCSTATPRSRPTAGVFLDRSYRMHPDLTAFVSDLAYEGRLEAAPGRERVGGAGGGAAVRERAAGACPVEHVMTRADKSQQEADVVARLWQSVQGSTWRTTSARSRGSGRTRCSSSRRTTRRSR